LLPKVAVSGWCAGGKTEASRVEQYDIGSREVAQRFGNAFAGRVTAGDKHLVDFGIGDARAAITRRRLAAMLPPGSSQQNFDGRERQQRRAHAERLCLRRDPCISPRRSIGGEADDVAGAHVLNYDGASDIALAQQPRGFGVRRFAENPTAQCMAARAGCCPSWDSGGENTSSDKGCQRAPKLHAPNFALRAWRAKREGERRLF